MFVVTGAHPGLEYVSRCALRHGQPEPEAVLKGVDVQKVAASAILQLATTARIAAPLREPGEVRHAGQALVASGFGDVRDLVTCRPSPREHVAVFAWSTH